MVLAHDVVEPRTADREDRDSPPVRPAHRDALELAATHEPEGSEEEVVGLKHWGLPVDCGRRGGLAFDTDRGGPVSPLISGRRREVLEDHARRRSAFLYDPLLKKPFKPETLSRAFGDL